MSRRGDDDRGPVDPRASLTAEYHRARTSTPDEILDHIVRRLHEPAQLDEDLCVLIGCGELENLISAHEDEIWLRVVEQATIDLRFRRVLSHSWAYDSPHWDERVALLAELDALPSDEDPAVIRRRSGARTGRGPRR